MINVTIKYQLAGTTTWRSVNTFQRPVMYSEKIDETLDFGQLVFQATQQLSLPPFTLVQITVEDSFGGNTTFYAVTGTPTSKMVRAV